MKDERSLTHSCLNKATFSEFPTRPVGRNINKYCKDTSILQMSDARDQRFKDGTMLMPVCKSQKRSSRKDHLFGYVTPVI